MPLLFKYDLHQLKLPIPDEFMTQKMREKVDLEDSEDSLVVIDVPDQFITPEMCENVVEIDAGLLEYVPDRFKTQKMCDKAVEKDLSNLKYVPDRF